MKFVYENSVTRSDMLQLLKERWTPVPQTEQVPLRDALGRITAQTLYSRNTLPLVRSSCFDGVAVRSSDFTDGMPDPSNWVQGRDFVRADTGDDFPDAFDTVISIENVILSGDSLRFAEGYQYDPREITVNRAGAIVKEGALLVPHHTLLTPELLAALAMGGISSVPVFRPLRIAYLPTGSELVPVGQTPSRGQNVETNGLMLSALLPQWGAQVQCMDICPDDPLSLDHALDDCLDQADLVLINGGSSRGEEDYNALMLQQRSSFFLHGVRTVPGRPIGCALIDGKPVLNIPGPVVACALAAHWCISALIAHYYGMPDPQCPLVRAKLTAPIKKRAGFERVVRLSLEYKDGIYLATPIDRDQRGLPSLLLRTDAFFTVPQSVPGYPAGQEVQVELLQRPELIQGAVSLL